MSGLNGNVVNEGAVEETLHIIPDVFPAMWSYDQERHDDPTSTWEYDRNI